MDDLADFLAEIRRRLGRSSVSPPELVVASVVRNRGSTPQKSGARMLIDPAGASLGTVGGGCGEAEVLSRAHRVLATGVPQLVEVSLLEDEGFDSSSICGGVLDVFLERWGKEVGGVSTAELFTLLDGGRASGRATALATVVEVPPGFGRASLLGRKTHIDDHGEQFFPLGEPALDEAILDHALEVLAGSRPREHVIELPRDSAACTADGGTASREQAWRVWIEPVAEAPEIVVVGAGHVGTALARLAASSGFAVTVLDDRLSFANPVRLPEVHRILTGDPRASLARLELRHDRHVVLVTRGHRLDAECLRVAIDMDLAYLGMIGSRRRVRRILEWLAEEGIAPAKLAGVHAPIGLDIAAETPAEIAVAILAEIIDCRRGGRGGAVSLSHDVPRARRSRAAG